MTRADLKNVLRWTAILFVCMLLLPFAAQLTHADEITLTWTDPTENTDGTPLTDLEAVEIYQLVTEVVPGTEVYTISEKLPGRYDYIAVARTTQGTFSVPSNQSGKDVTTWRVGADQTVYTVARALGRFILIAAGTVPTGTPCDPEQSVNGHYSVPIDQVTWSGTIRPVTVVAKCE